VVPGRTAILVVNGFDRRQRYGHYDAVEARRYPWIRLCLSQVARRTTGHDFRVLVWDNSWLSAHRRIMLRHDFVQVLEPPAPPRQRSHPAALDALVQAAPDAEYLVTLDTDALPVRDDWLGQLLGRLDTGATLAGVYRDEMAPRLRPFVHVSCLAIRRADLGRLRVRFARGMGQDVGQNLTVAVRRDGGRISPLRRTNVRNFHFLIGGIYGDLVYHHAAGSRRAMFWTSTDPELDERVRTTLRDVAFRDLDRLIAVLRGFEGDSFGLPGLPVPGPPHGHRGDRTP
jgi:hypothetical protein